MRLLHAIPFGGTDASTLTRALASAVAGADSCAHDYSDSGSVSCSKLGALSCAHDGAVHLGVSI